MQGAFSGGPFAEIAKRNMEMFGAATSAFKGATSEKKASTAAEEKDDEIAQLKAQLELLNSKIDRLGKRTEEHTSELQSLMRISYAVFCLQKKNTIHIKTTNTTRKQQKTINNTK